MDPSKYLDLVNNCDENAALLSDTSLGQYLDHIPLDSVQPSYLTQLHQSLNVEQLISTKNGLARDYRGLAELMGYNSVELESRFKRSYNPTKCLVDAFKVGRQGRPASVTDLLKLIENLERFDVLDDLLPTLIRIANGSHSDQQLTNHHVHHERRFCNDSESAGNLVAHGDDCGNNGLRQHRFDAFLCYAPEDVDYAQDVTTILERNNKRIVTVDNLLAGQFEYDALVQMIAVECRKVIIILTPNFLESRDCEFQAKFANEIAIKSGWFPKIIPILYEPFDDARLPPLIRVISKIDMTRANQRDWQLRKLLGSLDYDEQSLVKGTRKLSMNSCLPTINPSNEHGTRFETHGRELTLASNSHCDNIDDHLHVSEPIVDLAYSRISEARIDNQKSIRHDSRMSPTSSNGLSGTRPWFEVSRSWYRSFKRRVRGSSLSTSPSTSSRNILLPSTSSQLDSTTDISRRAEYRE